MGIRKKTSKGERLESRKELDSSLRWNDDGIGRPQAGQTHRSAPTER